MSLTCRADGNPAPVITWFDVREKRDHNATGGSLTVVEAKRKNSGEYECRARNYLGNSTARSAINILCKYPMNCAKNTYVRTYGWMEWMDGWIYVRTVIYVCMYVRICMYVGTYVRICMYVCMYVCMCTYVCMCVYVRM